jgi:hypothetical protein
MPDRDKDPLAPKQPKQENSWDKKAWKREQKIQKAGGLYTQRDKNANFKIKKIKRNFVGRDPFIRQKGRGFIDTKINFTVNWTPTKLALVTAFVGITYIGFIILMYSIGLKIVSIILIVVAALILGIGFLVRWLDKNL